MNILEKVTQDDDTYKNLLVLLIGLAAYSVTLWGLTLPYDVSDQLQNFVRIWSVLAWFISLTLTIIAIKRIPAHGKGILFWAGFLINLIYLGMPLISEFFI